MRANGLSLSTRIQDLAINYCQDQPSAIFTQIPYLKGNKNDYYPEFDPKKDAFRDEREEHHRDGDSKTKELKFNYTEHSYTINPYSMFTHVSEDEALELGSVDVDAVFDKTKALLNRNILYMNLDLSDILGDTDVWDDISAGDGWGSPAAWDTDSGDPERDFNYISEKIDTKTGGMYRANSMAMSLQAFNRMFLNKQVTTRTQSILVRRQEIIDALKDRFQIPNIWIIPGAKNTAKKGKAATMTNIWDTSVWVGYVNPSPSKSTQSAIVGVTLKDRPGQDTYGIRVSQLTKITEPFEDGRRGTRVFIDLNNNFKVVDSSLGYILKNTFTPA